MIVGDDYFKEAVNKYQILNDTVKCGNFDCTLNIHKNAISISFNDLPDFDDDDINVIESMAPIVVEYVTYNLLNRALEMYIASKYEYVEVLNCRYPFLDRVVQDIEDAGYNQEEILKLLIDDSLPVLPNLEKE